MFQHLIRRLYVLFWLSHGVNASAPPPADVKTTKLGGGGHHNRQANATIGGPLPRWDMVVTSHGEHPHDRPRIAFHLTINTRTRPLVIFSWLHFHLDASTWWGNPWWSKHEMGHLQRSYPSIAEIRLIFMPVLFSGIPHFWGCWESPT